MDKLSDQINDVNQFFNARSKKWDTLHEFMITGSMLNMASNLKIEDIHNSRGIGYNYTLSSILSNNYLISNLDLISKLNLASDQLRMTIMMVLMLKIMWQLRW